MAAYSGEEHSMNGFVDLYFRDEDIANISARMGSLQRNTPVILTRAANKAAARARTDIEKETTDKYLVLKRQVRRISKLDRARYSSPTAQLIYQEGFNNLARWRGSSGGNAVRPMKPHQGQTPFPKKYFAHVKKTNPQRALAGNGPIPFIQIPENGYKVLFRRTGRSRYPIKGVAGPAIPQVVKNEDTLTKVSKTTLDVMSREASRQMELYLSGKI